MAWEQEEGFDPDPDFEETGETLGEPWRGPFMDQRRTYAIILYYSCVYSHT